MNTKPALSRETLGRASFIFGLAPTLARSTRMRYAHENMQRSAPPIKVGNVGHHAPVLTLGSDRVRSEIAVCTEGGLMRRRIRARTWERPADATPVARSPIDTDRRTLAARLRQECTELQFYICHSVAFDRSTVAYPRQLSAELVLILEDVLQHLERDE